MPHLFTMPLANLAVCLLAFTISNQVQAQHTDAFGHVNGWKLAGDFSFKDKVSINQTTIGKGLSQIVANENGFFVAAGKQTSGKGAKVTEASASIAFFKHGAQTPSWRKEFMSVLRGNQQTFGGAGPSAQATPLLIDNRLIHVTFTGQLICLDQSDGSMIWEKDLVDEFDAVPVQFGFSSSPMVDPNRQGSIVMLASGKSGGLLNIDSKTGKLNWKAASDTFSYATPVAATIENTFQWIIVSEDDVAGISKDGQRLWSFSMQEKGLTNVPTPLVVGSDQIIISGQGVKGTRCLKISSNGKSWQATEKWFQPRLQFFYTNWAMLSEDTVVACTDKYLAVFDSTSGQVLGKFRGFGDGNLVKLDDDRLLILNGTGDLSVLKTIKENGQLMSLEQTNLFKLADSGKQRFWTPIAQSGTKLLTRAEDQLIIISMEDSNFKSTATRNADNVLTNSKSLALAQRTKVNQSTTADAQDPVEAITEAFQQKGQTAAWELYVQLRKQKKLTVEHRLELIRVSRQQGLNTLATTILEHAKKDFPNDQSIQSLK
ncbi:MAG: PQQ-binding-like beta-propeller repeat protein [Planctomycetota bacterium]